MTAQCLCLRDLGQEGIWRLLDAVRSQPEPSGALSGCRALCLTAHASPRTLEDRLSFAETLRTQGGILREIAPEEWLHSTDALTLQTPLYASCADVILAQEWEPCRLAAFAANCPVPLLNMGNEAGHPALALADLALMHQRTEDLSTLRIAWVGGLNGLGFSLMEAAMYVPFELFMALPEWSMPDRDLLDLALRAGARIFLSREPHLVLDEADVVYCGAGPRAEDGAPLRASMRLAADALALSCPGAEVLTAETLSPACRADDRLLEAAMPVWTRRLRMRQHMQALLLRTLLHPAAL